MSPGYPGRTQGASPWSLVRLDMASGTSCEPAAGPSHLHSSTHQAPAPGPPKQGLALATGMEMSKKVPYVLVGSLGHLRGMASDYVGTFNQCVTGGNFADSGLRRMSISFLGTVRPLCAPGS